MMYRGIVSHITLTFQFPKEEKKKNLTGTASFSKKKYKISISPLFPFLDCIDDDDGNDDSDNSGRSNSSSSRRMRIVMRSGRSR